MNDFNNTCDVLRDFLRKDIDESLSYLPKNILTIISQHIYGPVWGHIWDQGVEDDNYDVTI